MPRDSSSTPVTILQLNYRETCCEDIQAIHEELVTKGIVFELPPTETPRGMQAMFRDPDGNALVLWEHAGAQAEDVASEKLALRYQPF